MSLSGVSWSHEAIISLLDKVRENEVFWNIKHPNYPKKTLKRRLFEDIRNHLIQSHPGMASLTTDEVLAKFSYLRGNFQRVLRKIRNTPSGSGGKPEPKWEYFKACSFLLVVYDNTSFESSLELTPREEVVYSGTLDDLVQAEFSPLYSPRSTGMSPTPTSGSSTISPADEPCTSPEGQTPSPQAAVDTPTLQAVMDTPSPQDATHTPSPQDVTRTTPHQDVVYIASHKSSSLTTSTPATSATPRGVKRKMLDSSDPSGKVVQALDSVSNAMNAFLNKQENRQEKKTGKHDYLISSVQAFLSHPMPDRMKFEFGFKVMSLMQESLKTFLNETEED